MAESHFDRRQREWNASVTACWAALRGLPAVVVVIAVIGVLTLARHRQHGGDIRRRYLDSAQQAVAAKDWTSVETLGRKLAHLRPADSIGPYYVALAAEAAGETDRAARLMNQIAPGDRLSFAPAHWWLVRHLTTRHQQLSDDEVREVRAHLRQFLRINERHPEARVLLSQTELAVGNVDEAVRQMIVAGDLNPELRLTAARFAARLGDTNSARHQAEQASRYYRLRVDEDPADVEARLEWADTLTMLGETDRAARILTTGLDVTGDPRLRASFVRLCGNVFDILQESGDSAAGVRQKQLSLLKQSLSFAPRSAPVLKRLAQLAVQETPVGKEAAQLLDPYVSNGTAPPVVHLVLGTDALRRNQYETARRHFGRAHELDPAFPACMNNLAWSLAHGDHPDLHKALSLADQATGQDPNRPEFHDTRGQILILLGRYEEAIPELEQGLHTRGDVSATHACLAEAYEALDRPTLASYHRECGRSELPGP